MEADSHPQLSKAAHKRQIKEVRTKLSNLSPVAAAEAMEGMVAQQAKKQVNGFADFIREQGVVGIGIGLVLGIQMKAVVDVVMLKFVDPFTQLLLPGKTALSNITAHVRLAGRSADIGWGAIVYSLFSFLMVALIIYAAYKLLKLDRLKKV